MSLGVEIQKHKICHSPAKCDIDRRTIQPEPGTIHQAYRAVRRFYAATHRLPSYTVTSNFEWMRCSMKSVKVVDLVRDYDDLRAVNGLTFEVEVGEIFGLLGPNGAGKTTTLRILTGRLSPTSGNAWVGGYNVVDERQMIKPNIGVVFEYQNIYERLSGRDNLRFAARLYGVNGSRVESVLDQVGLLEKANIRAKKYSNGMKQRLLIARALLHEPQVLFFDEPTRGLDPHVARDIRAMVGDLAHRGVTVFLTTHYMEEADRLCDRVAIIDQGSIVALDSPQNLKSRHGATSLEDVFVQLTGRGIDRGISRGISRGINDYDYN
jgi:ABC-2 type transport system ATP-binding protein